MQHDSKLDLGPQVVVCKLEPQSVCEQRILVVLFLSTDNSKLVPFVFSVTMLQHEA